MSSIRLLPIVLIAISALLVFKTIGLVTQGGYVLLGTNQAIAQQAGAQPDAPSSTPDGSPALSPTQEAAAARAAESLFASKPVAPSTTEKSAASPDAQADTSPAKGNVSPTQEAVLQRLSERRIELDDRASKLDLQASLVKAAEARLNERIDELKALEARVQALVDMQNAQGDKAFASLVSMYENMKPNDAAAVFNTLDMNVLLRLALQINPRKMSPILAKMNTERAQLLTVRMASPQVNGTDMGLLNNTAPPANSALPQIVGK